MTTARKTWVRLHCRLLQDDAFLDLSPTARCAYLLGLLKAADTDGILPSKPSSVARFASISADEAAAAIEELVSSAFWIRDGETLVIRTWNKFQETLAQESQKRDQARIRKQRERGSVETAEDLTVQAVRQRLWGAIDNVITDGLDPQVAVGLYQRLHDDAIAAGSPGGKYAEVKGVGPVVLGCVVASHAASRWLGLEQDDPQIKRVWALRRDYGSKLFAVLPQAAAAAKGDPISYATKLLSKGGVR
jgi:hypothetical protein